MNGASVIPTLARQWIRIFYFRVPCRTGWHINGTEELVKLSRFHLYGMYIYNLHSTS